MAACSSVLAWKIPWTEEPGGLHSMGSQRVGHILATKDSTTVGVKWYLVALLICVALITKDIE